jgi:hypothetical protein
MFSFVYFTKLTVSQTIASNGRMIPGTADFWTLSIFDILKKTMFRKQFLFPSSSERVGVTYSVGPFRKS